MSSSTSVAPIATRGGSEASIGDSARFGVLTVSDRASSGVYKDLSGPAILQFFQEAVESPWEAVYRVVADEQPDIEAALIDMVSTHFLSGQHNEGCTVAIPPQQEAFRFQCVTY